MSDSSSHTPPAHNWLTHLIEQESLPASFNSLAGEHYLPLAKKIATWSKSQNNPLIIGINGGQGTGKSTLSRVLSLALKHQHKLSSATLSIDDLYLTRKDRLTLAEQTHPLFITRGVPGTHDTTLGIKLLKQLKAGHPTTLPVFDKSTDDRAPNDHWIRIDNPVDIILFEGWCVGAKPVTRDTLCTPINQLEKTEDADMRWRCYVNDTLQNDYQKLFTLIDRLVMLRAPDFKCIHNWRNKQEEKLRNSTTKHHAHSAVMTETQITRFIKHYERITRQMLEEMPTRADCVFKLTQDHDIEQSIYKHP